jgi:hypothetical protein
MPPKKKYVLVRNEPVAAAENYALTSGNEAAAEEALLALEPKKLRVKKTAVVAVPDPVPVAPTKSRKQKYKLVRNAPSVAVVTPTNEELVRAIPVTFGDEVQAALEEWYRIRGEPLPAEYTGFGSKVDIEERTRFKAEMDALYPPEPAPGAPAPEGPKPLGPKPEFGTPEFWKWTALRRKQIDAERAAEGLPPLPTKKEKEAAKQSRKAAREAKASAKKK